MGRDIMIKYVLIRLVFALLLLWSLATLARAEGDCDRFAHLCTSAHNPPAAKGIGRSGYVKYNTAMAPIRGKTAAINHGLGGQALANLGRLARAARAKGYTVEVDGNPNGKTLVVAHSISCLGAVGANAGKLILIDCPFWWSGTSRTANCVHYMAGGGPRVGNCRNIPIAGSHVAAPFTAERAIVSRM